MAQRDESSESYRAVSAVRDMIAEVQEIANLDQDLANQVGIGAIYSRYHATSRAVPGLASGSIDFTCFANEATVPAILGGPQDLNFDGDAGDDLGNQGAGTDLKLVPMRVTVTFANGNSLTMHRLIGKSTP
jgi:hypothetical protein